MLLSVLDKAYRLSLFNLKRLSSFIISRIINSFPCTYVRFSITKWKLDGEQLINFIIKVSINLRNIALMKNKNFIGSKRGNPRKVCCVLYAL